MILKYYKAQKAQGLLFVFIGLFALLVSYLLYLSINNLLTIGFIFPLSVLAVVQIFIGINTFFKARKLLTNVQSFVNSRQIEMRSVEIPRINAVLKTYQKFTNIYLSLIAASVVFMFLFNNNLFIKGFGIALFIQSLIAITAHYFANNRRKIYYKWLNDYYN